MVDKDQKKTLRASKAIVMRKISELKLESPNFFDNKILRIDQVAEMLGQSKSSIYRLTSQKKIPFRKKGKTLYFMSQEIFDWVNQGVA